MAIKTLTMDTLISLGNEINLQPKKGEKPESFQSRLADAFNELPDDEWPKLSEDAQSFSNEMAKEKLDKGEVELAESGSEELGEFPTQPGQEKASEEEHKPIINGPKPKIKKGNGGKVANKKTVTKPQTEVVKKGVKTEKKPTDKTKAYVEGVLHKGEQWREGSQAQNVFLIMKSAGKEGITIEAAVKVAGKQKIPAKSLLGAVKNTFGDAVLRKIAKKDGDNFISLC